jgi:hypothetical protein
MRYHSNLYICIYFALGMHPVAYYGLLDIAKFVRDLIHAVFYKLLLQCVKPLSQCSLGHSTCRIFISFLYQCLVSSLSATEQRRAFRPGQLSLGWWRPLWTLETSSTCVLLSSFIRAYPPYSACVFQREWPTCLTHLLHSCHRHSCVMREMFLCEYVTTPSQNKLTSLICLPQLKRVQRSNVVGWTTSPQPTRREDVGNRVSSARHILPIQSFIGRRWRRKTHYEK